MSGKDWKLSEATLRVIDPDTFRTKVGPMTPEEARALEVAQCARHAVMDTAALCARAGLIGSPIQDELQAAHNAMCKVIELIGGK